MKINLELIIKTLKYNQELVDTNLTENDQANKIADGINNIDENEEEN